MPYFRAHLNQDAWVHHGYVVEADSAEEAKFAGIDQWKGRRNDVVLVDRGYDGHDHVDACDIYDVEEITGEDYEAELAENKALAEYKPATTFTDAQADFERLKTPRAAETYMTLALQYQADDMIGDDTFLDAMSDIAEWLKTVD